MFVYYVLFFQVKGSDKSKRKWKLWRNSSEVIGFGNSIKKGNGFVGYDKYSCSSFVVNEEAFAAAMAAVLRTPHKDFLVIKQEWSAIRIQSAFRGFLVISSLMHNHMMLLFRKLLVLIGL